MHIKEQQNKYQAGAASRYTKTQLRYVLRQILESAAAVCLLLLYVDLILRRPPVFEFLNSDQKLRFYI